MTPFSGVRNSCVSVANRTVFSARDLFGRLHRVVTSRAVAMREPSGRSPLAPFIAAPIRRARLETPFVTDKFRRLHPAPGRARSAHRVWKGTRESGVEPQTPSIGGE